MSIYYYVGHAITHITKSSRRHRLHTLDGNEWAMNGAWYSFRTGPLLDKKKFPDFRSLWRMWRSWIYFSAKIACQINAGTLTTKRCLMIQHVSKDFCGIWQSSVWHTWLGCGLSKPSHDLILWKDFGRRPAQKTSEAVGLGVGLKRCCIPGIFFFWHGLIMRLLLCQTPSILLFLLRHSVENSTTHEEWAASMVSTLPRKCTLQPILSYLSSSQMKHFLHEELSCNVAKAPPTLRS